MAILESRTKTGIGWAKDSLALFSASPRKWCLLAMAYLLLFIGLPSLRYLEILALFAILLWPACIAFCLLLFQQFEQTRTFELAVNAQKVRAKVGWLALLGLACLVYANVVGLLLGDDINHVLQLANQQKQNSKLSILAPIMLKLALFMLPLLVVTWFSPLLITQNNYSVFKSVKSSLAGCLQYFIALLAAWLVLMSGMLSVLILISLLLAILPVSLTKMLGPLLVLLALLSVTALLLALQYVSYRDVFRAAPKG